MTTTPTDRQLYWKHLCEIKDQTQRAEIDRLDLEVQTQAVISDIEQSLRIAYDSLFFRAKIACDFFLEESERRKGRDGHWASGEAPGVRPYIRRFSAGRIEVGWYKLRFTERLASPDEVKHASSFFEKGRRVTVVRRQGRIYLRSAVYDRAKKGATKMRFAESLVKKEPEWVRDAFSFVEDRLEPIRAELKMLGVIRRQIRLIEQYQTNFFDAELAFTDPALRPERESVFTDTEETQEDQAL